VEVARGKKVALKLRVISDQYRQLGKRSSRLFGVSGGRIGRAADNDWVLPDPDRYISSHHAQVAFRAGAWILEDTSTNGVFVNGSDTPLSVAGAHKLQDGDRLRLGDYEVLVSIDERNDFPPDASGQMPVPSAVGARSRVVEDLGEELDIASLLLSGPEPATRSTTHEAFELSNAYGVEVPASPRSSAVERESSPGSLVGNMADEGPQRTVVHGKDSAEWHLATRPIERRKLAALTSSPKAEAESSPRPANGMRELDAGLEAFCRGIGIDPGTLPSEAQASMLTLAGQMLREVAVSLMDSLQSRSDLKNRLRLSQTAIQPGENNPFKFSASVDEAVRKLLDGHNSRYLGPIEAIRESFNDLKTHQASMNAATQAAVDALLERLEPRELQERFDRGLKRGSLLGAANKMKYWDLYAEFYQVLNQRDESGLPAVFSEELARAYAEYAAEPKPGGRQRG
jgi:type VI secretion system protein